MIYDVAVIGAGIIGASIARELSKLQLNICLVEKSNDVSTGTSKANSGIIHAGYDPVPGTLMAKLNVEGAALYPQWAKELHFDFKKIGSLVTAFSEEEMESVKELYERGKKNGVPDLKIVGKEELRKLEPEISDDAEGALFAGSAGIISPYQATWAIAENAVQNGVKLFLDAEVHGISRAENGVWTLHAGRADIEAKCVVNAAGLYADKISAMAGARNFTIKPRRGEYFLLDSNCGDIARHVLFQVPGKMGKGVLVTPTVDGNILVGPTAGDSTLKENTATTREGQEIIFDKGCRSIPGLPRRNIINSFAGVRAIAFNADGTPVNDFIIEEDSSVKGFINVAGICSPGLTAAPAVGVYVKDIVNRFFGGRLQPAPDFIAIRRGIELFKNASPEKKEQLIEQNPLYGRIICRCEMITEAEIVQAVKSTIGARDIDGVKRRTRAGMGRCQGGFCSPRVTEIISRECGIPMTSVTKSGGCSYILSARTREV